ncbi:MAG: site-specific DNA-methyltransferase [Firmicutes bacterium]|nr:site-specific DNA-methyltransferase [Bacillota bacterium]
MSLIAGFRDILEAGRIEYEKQEAIDFYMAETVEPKTACCKTGLAGYTAGLYRHLHWHNRLALGENGAYMKWLLQRQNMAGKIKMVYIDPPFFSKANYDATIRIPAGGEKGDKELSIKHLAYEDVWERGLNQYLTMLTSRLFFIRELLAENGTLWVHLDWHASHYVRVLLDEIFGADHFVNEIIWTYKSGGSSKRHFARKHDTILVYSKSDNYDFQPLQEKSYNRGLKPYRFKGVEEFQDEVGWYTLVNMKDVWQIDMVGRTSAERTGYATQKPEVLLERILSCCSQPGDICADFFCGSGTLAAVAQKMGRRWICCDRGNLAVSKTLERVLRDGQEGEPVALEYSKKDDCSFNRGKLLAEKRVLATVSSDRVRVQVKLDRWIPPFDDVRLEGEDLRALKKVAATDSLRLLSYWSVDFHYDGNVHRPEKIFFRGNHKEQKLIPSCETVNHKGIGPISVVAVDVLGNRGQIVI